MTEQEQAKAQRWIEFGKAMYEHGLNVTEALSKILYKKDDK